MNHTVTRIEREIKLRFASPTDARAAVHATGAILVRPRRLQDDHLLDHEDGTLRRARSILRVRRERDTALLTFKGPAQPSTMKVREEVETAIGQADEALHLLERLGLRVWFRYQKYREEYARDGALVAIDETPVGTFVEIEGAEQDIAETARALGRTPADYIVASYRTLYLQHCEARGQTASDMLFEN